MPVMKKDIDDMQARIAAINAEMAEHKAKSVAELNTFKAAILRQFKLIEARMKAPTPVAVSAPPYTDDPPTPVEASVSRLTEKPPKPKKK